MVTQILFLCPHNAAKSVMATAYFNSRARELGVEARAFSAGTEPDGDTAPHVAAFLNEKGYDARHKPRKVGRADLEKASRIISIGCALSDVPLADKDVPLADKNVIHWDDVPPPSQDLDEAWRKIKEHVDGLIGQL